MNDTNVHANNVLGTSRAAIIVAYFAVPAETTPTRCLKKKGRSLANIFDAQSDAHTTSTQANIQTILTPWEIRNVSEGSVYP